MDTDLLAELVRRKHDALLALRDLARRQVTLVGAADVTSLLALLSSKQKLLEELQETDRRLDPFREEDPESRRWSSLEARRLCQQTAQACAALLSEILLLEKHCETDLLLRRDDASERLQGAHAAHQARHAYARSAPTGVGQFDLSSEG